MHGIFPRCFAESVPKISFRDLGAKKEPKRSKRDRKQFKMDTNMLHSKYYIFFKNMIASIKYYELLQREFIIRFENLTLSFKKMTVSKKVKYFVQR